MDKDIRQAAEQMYDNWDSDKLDEREKFNRELNSPYPKVMEKWDTMTEKRKRWMFIERMCCGK